MLFPLPKPCLLSLNLLREPLPQLLLLFLELRVVQFLHLRFTELPRLHLLLPIVLVVGVLRGADEIQHVRPDEERAELAEITVVLVLNYYCYYYYLVRTDFNGVVKKEGRTFSYAPEVFTALDDPAIMCSDILSGTNDGEWDGV
jgi:hypothetical protein